MAYHSLDRRPSTSGSRRNTARQLMQSSGAPLSDGRQSSAITLPPSASTGLARNSGVDVNSRPGSMFPAPGAYAAARPTGLTPTRPSAVASTGMSRAPTGPGQISIAGKPVAQPTAPSATIGGSSYPATASQADIATDPSATIGDRSYPATASQAAIQPALDTPGTPAASPSTSAAPQTESNNPLTGAGNAQPGGTTDAIDPGKAMGFTQRGGGTPKGTDALPADPNMGGTGLYARRFANPRSAKIYDSYVRKIFGGAGPPLPH